MATRRPSGLKRAAPKKRPRKAAAGSRGIAALECRLEDLPAEAARTKDWVEREGGLVVAAYYDPLGKHPLLFAILPVDKVEPTPFQRDVSDMHHKRLADVLHKTGVFLDPIIAITAPELEEVLKTMTSRAAKFNADKVKQEDLASVGGAPDEGD